MFILIVFLILGKVFRVLLAAWELYLLNKIVVDFG